MIKSLLFPLAAIVLAGCGRGDAGGNAVAGPKAAAMRPASAATAPAICAPVPMLVLSDNFADPRDKFARESRPFDETEAHFAAAYRQACASGLLRGRALIEPGAGARDRLFLKNAPDANIASIYLDGEEGAPPAQLHMVVEYPFLAGDGAVHVPSTAELGEAIFCAVHGASAQESEESGRCLPD
jgi:hypothetical protein